MKHVQFLLIFLFVILSFVYYKISFGAENTDKVFITITTFFFSIFTGFFITRQSTRYTKIREIIGNFDGKMSGTYRVSGTISPEIQGKIGLIIKDHYQKILESHSWDYHFNNKSSTISNIQEVLNTEVAKNKLETLPTQAVARILSAMSDCQTLRKNMIMISQERIPSFQWFLICFFVLILLATVSVVPSSGFILGSILKSAFAISILSVVVILYNLDNLHLFEKFIGENSARDVVDIIDGNK